MPTILVQLPPPPRRIFRPSYGLAAAAVVGVGNQINCMV